MNLTGGLLDYPIAWLEGARVSMTPCVIPVLVITAVFIAGVNTKGTPWMGWTLSVRYVWGMATTYCVLGVVAALTGTMFGQVQSSPYAYLAVGAALLVFGLIMAEKIKLSLVAVYKIRDFHLENLWAVWLFGAGTGLAVGPCTSPVLGTLLSYVAAKQNIFNGVLLLFIFSTGVGASLILVGTLSGLLIHWPQSGRWLARVKFFCPMVLFVLGGYYLIRGGLMFR